MNSLYIGIDFGTTKTLVSYASDNSSKPEIAHLGRERYSVPTSAYVGESGSWEFGDDADDYACDPVLADRFVGKFKLKLGSPSPVLQVFSESGFTSYSARDLTAKYLEYIRLRCEKEVFNGLPVAKATITYPIHFSPAQIDDLRKAGELAGFSELNLLREPESAGIAFCNLCPKAAFTGVALIVDWGGGTLDLALVSREGEKVKVHSNYVAGSDTIGGVVFDELLWKHVAGRLQQEHNIDISQELRDVIRLQKKKISAAKEKLSRTEIVNLSLPGSRQAYPMLKITREEFEKIIQDFVITGVEGITELLNSIKESSLKPTQVLLIGGSSQIPLISRLITEKTGLPCNRWQFSHEAVAMGATLFYGVGLAQEQKAQDVQLESIPPPKNIRDNSPNTGNKKSPEVAKKEKNTDRSLKRPPEVPNAVQPGVVGGTDTNPANPSEKVKAPSYDNLWKIALLASVIFVLMPLLLYKLSSDSDKKSQDSTEAHTIVSTATVSDNSTSPSAHVETAQELYNRGCQEFDNNYYTNAVELFRQAADMGHAEAQFRLGQCYEKGNGVNENHVEAVKWYRKAAEQGDAFAQNILGWCYRNGWGVEQNYTEAVRLYQLSAEQGNAFAQYNLGRCYQNGWGVVKNEAEAVKWYRKAAEQGNAFAQYNLGWCYEAGCGVEKNYAEAVKWYTKSAEQGNAFAQNGLGLCYQNGRGVEQNYTEAVRLYQLSAEQGNADAQCNLGGCYEIGEGVERNYAEAVKWYTKSAEQGNAFAQLSLGWCYQNGRGVEKNYAEAVKWYRKAAEQGNAFAQNDLGWCYQNGWGVEKNYAEAVRLYHLSANQGCADAQYRLGFCYRRGRGVKKNKTIARDWYQKAAAQGHEKAQKALNKMR